MQLYSYSQQQIEVVREEGLALNPPLEFAVIVPALVHMHVHVRVRVRVRVLHVLAFALAHGLLPELVLEPLTSASL